MSGAEFRSGLVRRAAIAAEFGAADACLMRGAGSLGLLGATYINPYGKVSPRLRG
jgi:hypothetical protein